jgi:anti-sigma regulatory factor (Ser/Thr protein kinase)
MSAVLDEARRLFAREAAQRGLRLRVRQPAHMPALCTDAVLLRQMVFNLLQNALRYTDQGGVLLALRHRQGRWLLQVWDSGCGMSEQECAQVFKRHYRSPARQQRDARDGVPAPLRGRGLGLSVVALAAQRLGVECGVQSLPGKGSCFWLRWPQDAEQWQASSVLPAPPILTGPQWFAPCRGNAWSWKTMRSWPRCWYGFCRAGVCRCKERAAWLKRSNCWPMDCGQTLCCATSG